MFSSSMVQTQLRFVEYRGIHANYDDNDCSQGVIVEYGNSIYDVSDENATIWFTSPSKAGSVITSYYQGRVGKQFM